MQSFKQYVESKQESEKPPQAKKGRGLKIIPMQPDRGVGFTTIGEPYDKAPAHRYEPVDRWHNYHVTPQSYKWPIQPELPPQKTFDAFSPNVNKDLHVGHLRNMALARAFKGLYPNAKFVSMLGYSLGEKAGSAKNLKNWFDFIGYNPELHRDIDLKGPEDELKPGEGPYEGGQVWHGPRGPVLMKRSATHAERPSQHTYAYHDLAFNKTVNPTHVLTGAEQKQHFEELGMTDKHLPMGLVLDPKTGEKMKSRDGTALSATESLQAIIDKLAPTKEPKKLAWNVLVWNFLKVGRERNIRFNTEEWAKADSPGLYITYTSSRILSALRKAGWANEPIPTKETDFEDKDIKLMGFAEYYNHWLNTAREQIDPAPIANFALDLAKKLGKSYTEEKLVNGRPGYIRSVQYAFDVLKKCMEILGMFILDEI